MRFDDPLIQGTLVRRYKRFMADVTLADGSVTTAHCPNSGSMRSVDTPGSEVWISPTRNPKRVLRHTWEMIRVGDGLVGINTHRPNGLVAEAVAEGAIGELTGYDTVRREVKYGKSSRIDLLLETAERPPCYVEVKNVTMRRDLSPSAPAEFPDAVTQRGTKHLHELAAMVAQGARAVMLYLAQRDDAETLVIATDIDPTYGRALVEAQAAGVEVLAYRCRLSPEEICVASQLTVHMPGAASM